MTSFYLLYKPRFRSVIKQYLSHIFDLSTIGISHHKTILMTNVNGLFHNLQMGFMYDTISSMGMLQNLLPWVQIALSVVLIITVLLQQNASSAGAAFGGGESTTLHTTRRGFEKVLFITTIVLAILFAASAVVAVIL